MINFVYSRLTRYFEIYQMTKVPQQFFFFWGKKKSRCYNTYSIMCNSVPQLGYGKLREKKVGNKLRILDTFSVEFVRRSSFNGLDVVRVEQCFAVYRTLCGTREAEKGNGRMTQKKKNKKP